MSLELVGLSREEKLSLYKKERPEQYNVATLIFQNINQGQKINLLWAELKTGKREVMEIFSLLCGPGHNVVLVMALNRLDMKKQFQDLKASYVKEIITTNKAEELMAMDFLSKDKYNVIMIDECDYGTKEKQNMHLFLTKLSEDEKLWSNTSIFGLSATPYTMALWLDKFDVEPIVMVPNKAYIGIDKLPITIVKGIPFDTKGNPSIDLCSILQQWKNDPRKKLVVRDVACTLEKFDKIKNNPIIRNIIPEANFTLVNQNNKTFQWERTKEQWDNSGKELIIVVQTCTRGTETDMHHQCFGYYDPSETNLDTFVQRAGRYASYRNVYPNLFVSKTGSEQIQDYSNICTQLKKDVKLGLRTILESSAKSMKLSAGLSVRHQKADTWLYLYDKATVSSKKVAGEHLSIGHANASTIARISRGMRNSVDAQGKWDGNNGCVSMQPNAIHLMHQELIDILKREKLWNIFTQLKSSEWLVIQAERQTRNENKSTLNEDEKSMLNHLPKLTSIMQKNATKKKPLDT